MCEGVTMLYSRKLTEHCKPAIMEKKKSLHKKSILWDVKQELKITSYNHMYWDGQNGTRKELSRRISALSILFEFL